MVKNYFTFGEHNKRTAKSVKKMTAWVFKIFKMKEAKPMITMFNALVLSHMNYCCVLTSLYRGGETGELKNIKRSFTFHTNLLKHLNNWDKLKALKLHL